MKWILTGEDLIIVAIISLVIFILFKLLQKFCRYSLYGFPVEVDEWGDYSLLSRILIWFVPLFSFILYGKYPLDEALVEIEHDKYWAEHGIDEDNEKGDRNE